MDNQTMMQYFEWNLSADGLLWQRAAAQAKTLKEMGIDVVWLPPAYKGAAGVNDTGYGVYDLYDLGEFDQKQTVATKYGTKKEYINAIKALNDAGIQVLADIVLNHRMGADETQEIRATECKPENRLEKIDGPVTIEAWTKFDFPGRKGKYSGFEWNQTCFTGIDWDERAKRKGVFLLEGRKWSEHVSTELGNYDYLMGADVDMQNPYVAQELENWGRWFIQTTGADGFRLDALKHIDYDFYAKWLTNMRNLLGKPLFTVGEYWSVDANELQQYLTHMDEAISLFDVPLHFNFHYASTGQGYFNMRNILNSSYVAKNPDCAVTFVDNHDTQPGQALESWVEDWFKPIAYAFILLRKGGLPCIFYADYYGRRRDGAPPVPGIKHMFAARKRLAYGEQHDYFDHDNVVGWTMEGDKEHPASGLAVLLSDGPEGEKTMYVGKAFSGQIFRDVLGRIKDEAVIDSDGNGLFKAPGGGVSLWVLPEAYEKLTIEIE